VCPLQPIDPRLAGADARVDLTSGLNLLVRTGAATETSEL
jgi:hypothetical protein